MTHSPTNTASRELPEPFAYLSANPQQGFTCEANSTYFQSLQESARRGKPCWPADAKLLYTAEQMHAYAGDGVADSLRATLAARNYRTDGDLKALLSRIESMALEDRDCINAGQSIIAEYKTRLAALRSKQPTESDADRAVHLQSFAPGRTTAFEATLVPYSALPALMAYPEPDPETGADRGPCCAHAYTDGWNEAIEAVRRVPALRSKPAASEGDMARALEWFNDHTLYFIFQPEELPHIAAIKEAIAAYDPDRMASCGNTARVDAGRVEFAVCEVNTLTKWVQAPFGVVRSRDEVIVAHCTHKDSAEEVASALNGQPRMVMPLEESIRIGNELLATAKTDHQQSSGDSGQLANNQIQVLEKIEQLPDASAGGEVHLRWLLARVYSGANLYCDDGEMSDSSAHPAIDFLRDDSGTIESKICARTLAGAALRTPAKNEAAAWVVANGQGDKWRMWGDSGPEWTEDREKALQFARRDDAESFSRDDEDAWLIQPVHALARMADGFAVCCECKSRVDTRENGTLGAELTDGRWVCSDDCWERATAETLPLSGQVSNEASEDMCDAVRHMLIGLEAPGQTFGGIRQHCEWAGMDTSHWPEWTKGRDTEHFNKSARAALIWHCMNHAKTEPTSQQ